jgi:hypothetical protein
LRLTALSLLAGRLRLLLLLLTALSTALRRKQRD